MTIKPPFLDENLIVICKNAKHANLMMDRTTGFLRKLQIPFWYDMVPMKIDILGFNASIKITTESRNQDGLRGRKITMTEMENYIDSYEKALQKEKEKNMASCDIFLNNRFVFGVDDAKENEEWIWVEGYKGTNKDLTCRDYQFELGKQFDMPEGSTIRECSSGFHFCINLKDTFKYYAIKDGHRFFRVRALVRKSDFDSAVLMSRDKIVAKSILFMYEMTAEEILKAADIEASKWTEEDKLAALDMGTKYIQKRYRELELVSLGYSEAFAKYLVDNNLEEAARIAGSQKDLSMDMKVLMILQHGASASSITRMINDSLASAASSAAASARNMSNAFARVGWR